jgi:ABC-type multidrug transport system fused ATPase/permease subunit
VLLSKTTTLMYLSYLLRFLRPFIPSKYKMLLLSASGAASALLSAASFAVLVPILALAFSNSAGSSPAWLGGTLGAMHDFFIRIGNEKGMAFVFISAAAALAGIFALKNAAAYIYLKLMVRHRVYISKALRQALFESVIMADYKELKTKKQAEIVSAIVSDVSEIDRGVLFFGEDLIIQPLRVAAFSVLAIYIHPVIGAFSVAVCLGSVAFSGLRSKSQSVKYGKSRKKLAALSVIATASLRQLKSVKLSGGEKRAASIFAGANFVFSQSQAANYTRHGYAPIAGEMLGIASLSVFCVSVGAAISYGHVSAAPDQILALVIVLSRLLTPMRRLFTASSSLAQIRGVAIRLQEILDIKKEDCNSGIDTGLIETIRVNNLCMGYPGKERVLNGVDFSLERGTTYAIAGLSGSGKTSLIDCLTSIEQPLSGTVLINGKDINRYSLKHKRRRICCVPQNESIGGSSIAAEIRQESGALPDEIEAALQAVGLLGVRSSSEGGMYAATHPDSLLFSGGEYQRISIARAMLRKPDVLILDEASSAVDPITEKEIFSKLKSSGIGIIIIVSHRAGTLAMADEVLLLHKGRIEERGSFAQLKDKGGIFSQIITH